MAQPPGHQGHRERQRSQHVPAGKPEAEHRGGQKGSDSHLRAQRGRAQPRRGLGAVVLGQHAHEPLAARPRKQPQAEQGQRQHGRPAQQAVVAVDPQRDDAVCALEVADRERGVGGVVARVGGRAVVERLVHAHVGGDAEERQLDRADRQKRPPLRPHARHRERRNHHARRQELGAEPRQRTHEREAGHAVAAPNPLVQAQRQQDRTRQRGGGGRLRIDGGAVRQHRRRQTECKRRPEGPRIGHHAQRQPVGDRDRQGGQRGHQQLDRGRPSQRIGGDYQEREAGAVRFVQHPIAHLAVHVQLVRIEVVVLALAVVVEHVQVAVLDDRMGRQEVVRLVAAVLGVAERT